MRKSGLQKQISSIFSDVPAPQVETGDLQLLEEQGNTQTTPNQPEAAESPQAKQPLESPETGESIESIHTPAVSVMRPKPLPKIQTEKSQQKSTQTVVSWVKEIMAGSGEGINDARQKKLTVLVGFLSVTFIGVLFISLGGLGQKDTSSGAQTTQQAQPEPLKAPTVDEWQMPDPLPDKMRNPAQPVIAGITPIGGIQDNVADGPLSVTGIVFSNDNPSAIVDGKFARQGDTIKDMKIVTINRDSVEFEKDGKRWTQQVKH